MALEDHLQEPLPTGLLDRLVSGLDRAWKECLRLHDPAVGHDGMSLGMQLYRVGHFWVERVAEGIPGVRSERQHGAVILYTSGALIRTYQRGQGPDFPIELHVLADETPALRRLAEANDAAHDMLLFDPDPYGDEEPLHPGSPFQGLALVHAGRYPDGLQAVWLGEPATPETGKAWHWVTPIWLAEPAQQELDAMQPLAPFEDNVIELPIRLEYREPAEDKDGDVGTQDDG